MTAKNVFKWTCLATMAFLALQANAARTVTDQLGRAVTIPDEVNRMVVLQHQSLDILVQLDANKQIVGVLNNWQRQLGPEFGRFMPSLEAMPTPGDLTSVNMESLLALNPDVVIVTNYAPQDMIDQITKAGIPVVAVSLREFVPGQAAELNPTLANESKAYNEGLKQGIELLGTVANKQKNAQALIKWVYDHQALIQSRVKDYPAQKRPRTLISNPGLVTYGSGKFVNVMLTEAGAVNVAEKAVVGYKPVTMEQIIGWDPDVIWVQNRYPEQVKTIEEGQPWQVISAVKNKRVYFMPEYAKLWGYPTPEAVGLGELWMAKKLYPDLFKDVDMTALAQEYYQRFYRVSWVDSPASVK